MSRKPWETPIEYNDDRFANEQAANFQPSDGSAAEDERDASDVEEILRRPDVTTEREYECKNLPPINYTKGPHDSEFGTDDGTTGDFEAEELEAADHSEDDITDWPTEGSQ